MATAFSDMGSIFVSYIIMIWSFTIAFYVAFSLDQAVFTVSYWMGFSQGSFKTGY